MQTLDYYVTITSMENNTNLNQEKVTSNPEVVSNNNQKLSTPVAIIIAGFLIMVGIFASGGVSKGKVDTNVKGNDIQAPTNVSLNPVSASDHILGNLQTAKITIVEFSDLECPFCKTFHNALHASFDKYPGQIAWIYRHFPLDNIHPKTRMEARASECAASIGGNDAFWKYIDLVFATTPANNGLDANLLPVFASKIGLDKVAFASCLASTKFDEVVQSQYEDGVNAGVAGTPHSIVIMPDGSQIPIKGADVNGLNKLLETVLK